MALSIQSSGSGGGTTISTLNVSATVSSGSDLILVVSLAATPGITISSVKWGGSGGANLTQAVSNTANGRADIWYIVNPVVQTADINIQTSSGPYDHIALGYIVFTGAEQTTPIGATATQNNGGGTSVSQNPTTIRDNSYLIDCLEINANGTVATVGADQTIFFNQSQGDTAKEQRGSYEVTTTAGSYTMSWTLDVSSQFSYSVAEIKSAADATTTTTTTTSSTSTSTSSSTTSSTSSSTSTTSSNTSTSSTTTSATSTSSTTSTTTSATSTSSTSSTSSTISSTSSSTSSTTTEFPFLIPNLQIKPITPMTKITT